MAADGELSSRRAASVRGHLQSCWSCRTRVKEMEAAIADFIHLDRELDSKLPPVAGPRALLRARLTALAEESGMSFGTWLHDLGRLRSSYKFILAAFAGVLALVLAIRVGSLVDPATYLEAAAVPKPQLTPGATVPMTKQQVCGVSSLTQGPLVPASLQQQVFAAYGISNPRPGSYEIDYLITPDLGGTANIRNLWPQPYSNTVWNARVKDQLEERLHAMVCNGEVDLATAQHDLATDWVAAYKKYFRTDRPQPRHPKAQNRARQFQPYLYVEEPGRASMYTLRIAAFQNSRAHLESPRTSGLN